MANPIDWYNVTFSVGNSTAFEIYDQEEQFVTASNKMVKYIVRSLGYPVTNVQLYPEHIFTAFESSIMKYSTIVNQAKISDNMLNVFGSDPNRDLTRAAIFENLGSTFEISTMYGQESTIRNSLHVQIYTTSFTTTVGQQQYDLRDCISEYTNSNVQIVEVYYYPLLYQSNAFDPLMNPGFNMASIMHEFGGVYSQNARLVMMPVYEALLKMQHLEMSQQIRRSHIGFELRKNKLILYPAPKNNFGVCIDYILKTDKHDNAIKEDTVNNIANFPINSYIKYQEINTPGRNWVQRYCLALCKQMLGIIRSKFASIPYPEGETAMDGQTLRTEAVTEQDKLVQELKMILEQSSMAKLIEKKKDMAQNLQVINSKVPMGIYIG